MASLLHFIKVVRNNGGIWGSLKAIYLRDTLKDGKLVGEDDFGNLYYEDDKYFLGRNRWVHYAPHVQLEYDASQVAPEWHGWLHNRTDNPPYKEAFRPKYPWMAPATENMSGTNEQFVPYSTTRPKIEAWKPKSTTPKECCFRPKKPKTEKKAEDECCVKDKPKPSPCEKP